MRKICNFVLILLFSLYALHLPFYIRETFALAASSSLDMKSKIKALQEEVASRAGAANLKLEVTKKLQNKAFVGFIKSKSDNSLILATDNGTKLINITEYTEYTGKGKVGIKTIAPEDYIAALGDIDDNGVLTAKRVVKLTPEQPSKKQIFFGQISSIAGQLVTISTRSTDPNQNNTLTLTKNTIYQQGKNTVNSSDLKIGQTVIAVGQALPNGTTGAKFIYIKSGSASAKISPAPTNKK